MALSKADRARVFGLFNGRCAYCGCVLPARWHVDHVEPVIRYREGGHSDGKLLMLRPECERADNYWPACPPCNIDKHRMTIEAWRGWLNVRLKALTKTPGWKLLEAHGLVAETGAAVQFHFETALHHTGQAGEGDDRG